MKTLVTQAIYEDGVFKPLQKMELEPQREVHLVIVITEGNDTTDLIDEHGLSVQRVCPRSSIKSVVSKDLKRRIYTLEDGESIWE